MVAQLVSGLAELTDVGKANAFHVHPASSSVDERLMGFLLGDPSDRNLLRRPMSLITFLALGVMECCSKMKSLFSRKSLS